MARIAGVDLPNKHVNIALTYIYGIGRPSADDICAKAKIDPMRMMNDLNQDELKAVTTVIDTEHKVEGRLRTESRSEHQTSHGYWLLPGPPAQKGSSCPRSENTD